MKSCLKHYWLVAFLAFYGFASQVLAQSFTTLHSFSGSDGRSSSAGLVMSGGVLYGTAYEGGIFGWGTIYRINTDGTGFAKLHDFMWNHTNTDGALPNASLILGNGTLYGTTIGGGISGNGTVFAINTDGSDFRNLHMFSGSDGAGAWGGLVLSGNTLYGTTLGGGSASNGTVFAVNTDGSGFTNLHTFNLGGGANPYAGPYAGLVLSGNTLYGTTQGGGSSGNGGVFAVNIDGSGYRTLYSFAPLTPACCWVDWFTNSDGAHVFGRLVVSGTTLYGTAYDCGLHGYGTVFKLETDGTGFTILHTFNVADGANPNASLVLSGNTLYGTTYVGGWSGTGTAFALNIDGTGFTTLYSFEGSYPEDYLNSSGATPLAELALSGGVLYGTTQQSGMLCDCGTVFSISLLPRLALALTERNIVLSWLVNFVGFDYSGFTLQSTTNLASPIWTTNLPAPVVVNGQYTVTNPISGTQQFFRLSR